jgi:predicted nucleic acid-binding protein
VSRYVLADTGPLYALADSSDQHHTRAHEELNRLQDVGQIVAVTFLTLAETHTLVMRRLGGVFAHRWLEELLDGALPINPEPNDFIVAYQLVRRFPDQSITVFDAVTAIVGKRLTMEVWAYDWHFDLLGAPRWS